MYICVLRVFAGCVYVWPPSQHTIKGRMGYGPTLVRLNEGHDEHDINGILRVYGMSCCIVPLFVVCVKCMYYVYIPGTCVRSYL